MNRKNIFQINPKLPTFLRNLLPKKTNTVVCDADHLVFQIHLGTGYFMINPQSSSIDEIYTLTQNIISARMVYQGRFYITFHEKPLMRGRLVDDYCIPNYTTLEVVLPQMCGGSKTPEVTILLPLYTHVLECEKQVLEESLHLQSADITDPLFKNWEVLTKILSKWTDETFPGGDMSWLHTQAENIAILTNYASKCNNVNDYYVLTQIAYRLFTGNCLTAVAVKRITAIFRPEVQAFDTGETLRVLRGAFDMTTSITECSLSKKLVSLYSFLLTQGFLKHFGLTLSDEDYSKLEQRAMLSAFSSKKAFFMCVVDTTLFVCERIHEWHSTGDVTAFVHSGSEYNAWSTEADRLLNLAPFWSNLKPHGTSTFTFIADLKSAIEKGEAYAKYTRATAGVDSIHISRKLNSLRLLDNTIITRSAAQQERPSPMGVLVHGSSSVAKSAFTKMLFNYYGSLFDYDRDDSYRYVRNPMDEYWSNFDTSKWCIQLDDIAFLNPAKTTSIDTTLQDLLNVCNNVPYVPPQADLADKGKTPVMAKLVIATSNSASLNAQEYFWCPLAAQRRLPYVVNVKPKAEFLHANQVFIDPSKILVEEGKFPDLWDIEVSQVVPRLYAEREFAEHKVTAMFSRVEDFLQHFGKACLAHEANQKRAMAKDDDMLKISVCKKCLKPLPHAECMDIQFGTATIGRWITNFVIYLMTISIQFKWFYSLLEYMAYYRLTRRMACMFMNCVTDIPAHFRFYGSLSELMRDNNTKRMLVCCAAIVTAVTVFTVMRPLVTVQPAEKVITEITTEQVAEDEEEDPEYEVQGNVYGTTEDQLLKEERSNVWYNPAIELTTFDVPKASTSLVGVSADGVRDMFARNCVMLRIKVDGESTTRIMRGIFIKGHKCVTNGHAFKNTGTDYTIEIIQSGVSQGLNSNLAVRMKRRDIAFSSTNDVCMFEVDSIPPYKDITSFWCEQQISPTSSIALMREQDGTIAKRNLFALSLIKDMPVAELDGNYDVHLGVCDVDTEEGMCGSLCVAITPRGPIIFGLHFLGRQQNVGILSVTRVELDSLSAQSNMSTRPIVQAGTAPVLTCAKRTHALGPVHHKSLFRYIEGGALNIYGSFVGFRPKPKSRVCATPLQSVMLAHYGTSVAYGQPKMSGWEPWRKNVIEMVKPNVMYDRSVLRECRKQFTNDILSSLPLGWEKELVILSDLASVNGLPGVMYIDKMSTNTSMGFPWCTTKKEFLQEAISEKYPNGVDFGPEVWDRVRTIEREYAEGRRVYPIFSGHLKDEATALAKCAVGKTRLFTGSPVDWSLVVRRNLLSFVRLVQKNKTVFEAGPGTVCQSAEWGFMYEYLTAFGKDRMVAGDYGKFDKRMLADFILAAFEIIVDIFRAAGYDAERLRIIMCIGEDIAFPVSNINGDLVEFFGTNPSGHPLTVIINSLVNALYMRYCYLLLNPAKEVATFKENVHLMTYGDDNTCGVSPKAGFFNHTAIQVEMAKIGVEYTMADKTSASIPYIHIDDVSFLKRRWVWSKDLNNWICPLEEDSIIKSLTVWVPSHTVDEHFQMVSVISSANSEYFFHGRAKFEEKHAFFSKVLEQFPYNCYVTETTLPTYQELVERFQRASLGMVAL